MAKPIKKKSSVEDDMQTELLLKEADEALRQENLERLWKQWGNTIVGVALMLVLGTMLGVGWKNWRHNVNAEQTQILIESQDKGALGLQIAKDGGIDGVHQGLMNLLLAGQMVSENSEDTASQSDNEAMVLEMMKAAEESGLPIEWESVALWTRMRIEANQASTAEEKIAIADDMVNLSDDNDNPYAPAILVEAATLYGENGQVDKAKNMLNRAKNHEAAQKNAALLNLIQKLDHLYTVDQK